MFPRTIGRLGALRPSVRVVEAAPPKGIGATDALFRSVAAAAGADAEPVLAALPVRARALAEVEGLRAHVAGRRLAFGIGSLHDFEPEHLAREGLGDLPLLRELGFDVEVVIQERDRPEVHARIRRDLAAFGCDVPYRLFYEPGVLAPVLREGRFDAAVLADFLGDQAAAAGVPMVRFGAFGSGYGGAIDACRLVRQAFLARGGAG
jgi:hypothetical protein